VGWLKTVDQYYYGANNTIQHAAVRFILTTVVHALEEDANRKFVYVEQAFFTRWWFDQTPKMQKRVKALVASGQLSFANGGWCMHDEAATHYLGMLDQTKLGHDFLRDTFDYVPTVGWQIDPFGHSAAQASLMSAEVGFDALYFGRIDYQDIGKRRDEKRVEGLWRSSNSLKEKAEVFWGLTGSNWGNYQPPEGFDFDLTWSDEPIIGASPGLYGNNIPAKVADFVNKAWEQVRLAP
jgi:alpha-mannosidase